LLIFIFFKIYNLKKNKKKKKNEKGGGGGYKQLKGSKRFRQVCHHQGSCCFQIIVFKKDKQ